MIEMHLHCYGRRGFRLGGALRRDNYDLTGPVNRIDELTTTQFKPFILSEIDQI